MRSISAATDAAQSAETALPNGAGGPAAGRNARARDWFVPRQRLADAPHRERNRLAHVAGDHAQVRVFLEHAREHRGGDHLVLAEGAEPADGLHRGVVAAVVEVRHVGGEPAADARDVPAAVALGVGEEPVGVILVEMGAPRIGRVGVGESGNCHLGDSGSSLATGAGSIGIEWMRAERSARAIAIEERPDRFARLEEEFGPVVLRGDATEISVLTELAPTD